MHWAKKAFHSEKFSIFKKVNLEKNQKKKEDKGLGGDFWVLGQVQNFTCDFFAFACKYCFNSLHQPGILQFSERQLKLLKLLL